MSEKLYMPVSLILSALILSGTILMVGASVSEDITGLTVAIGNAPAQVIASSDDGGVAKAAPAPTPTPGQAINMEALIDDDAFKGDPDAPITIVEFSDFQCPFCSRFYENTLPELKKEYIDTGKVKIVYRDFPLSFHPEAQGGAEAAECANDQGKFWEMHDKIFENQAIMGTSSYKAWAEELGLDTEQFNSCLDNGDKTAEVRADFAAGQAAGVSGTPTFFINGQKIVGAQPFSVFKQAIDAELAE